ncbi:transmembrane protein 160-like [Gigantopelta aegis]|uniref:transmembrane protein 160-like n=1 Tax=Gigantopelta aegis TaxID=1735272 RepID=UPI001B88AFB8|nr:transmembrane protein 160-like [Gigantopelta aegis]
MKMISRFLNRCCWCIQRNLHSVSTYSRQNAIFCQTSCLYSSTLPHVNVHRKGAVWGTSLSRTFYFAAERLSRLGIGGDYHHEIDSHHGDDRMSENRMREKTSESNLGWSVRLANENGYLSWCRNTYLVTMVGIAMQAEGAFAMSQHAAEVAFLLAGMNLLWGTCSFASNIVLLRRHVEMSVPVAVMHVVGVFLHFLLWVCIVLMYIGVSEEDNRADSSTESS